MASRSRRVSSAQAPSAEPVAEQQQVQAPVQPELTPEQREILDAMNSLIMAAQELSYALALLPNELVESHQELRELVDAARSVVKATWRFHKLIKGRMGR